MKSEKQKLALDILGNGKYRVDFSRGVLQSFRKNLNEWVDCVHTLLPSGYKQNIIHLGRGQNTKITVYLHNLIWLACNGEFPEDKIVKHKDGDLGNCALSNLELLSLSESSGQNTKPLVDEIAELRKEVEYQKSGYITLKEYLKTDDILGAIMKLKSELKASKSEANEWISVLLALPNDGIEVSVRLDCAYNGNGIIEPKSSAKFNHSTKYWESGLSTLYSVTHWKTLT